MTREQSFRRDQGGELSGCWTKSLRSALSTGVFIVPESPIGQEDMSAEEACVTSGILPSSISPERDFHLVFLFTMFALVPLGVSNGLNEELNLHCSLLHFVLGRPAQR